MSTELKCAFCTLQNDENVHLFSEETLNKCQSILRLRKVHNLKYKNVILPREIYDSGYHRTCYKTFTALKKKFYQTKITKTTEVSSLTPESSAQSSEPSSIEQPSTSVNIPIIADIVKQDSSAENVDIPVSCLLYTSRCV